MCRAYRHKRQSHLRKKFGFRLQAAARPLVLADCPRQAHGQPSVGFSEDVLHAIMNSRPA
jgi:hypothetical protein